MTEKQWLRSANAETMNDFYGDRHTERKARLLMLACCLRHPDHLAHAAVRPVVEMLVAHYADPRKRDTPFGGRKVVAAYKKLETYASSTAGGPERGLAFGVVAAAEPVSVMKRLQEDFEYLVFSSLHDVAFGVAESDRGRRREKKVQAQLAREILGNPFRPVAFRGEWRTDTAVSLARLMYTTEDFSVAPILADAIQDAGCADEGVLHHLLDPNAGHVRGCWAIDLVLGKK